jgi:hypothetical protein
MSLGNLNSLTKVASKLSMEDLDQEEFKKETTHEDVVHNSTSNGVGEIIGEDLVDARAINDPNVNTDPLDAAKMKTIQSIASAMRTDKNVKKEIIQAADSLAAGGMATKEQVSQIQKDLGNDKILEKAEKDGTFGFGLMDNLKDALTFMSPKIIAMAIGGSSGAGGGAGALAGYQLGAQAQKSVADFVESQQKGSGLTEYQKQSLDLRNQELGQRKITEKRLSGEQGKREDRFNLEYNRKIKKEMKLSDAQMETVTNLNVALDISNRMSELIDKNYLGPFASRLQSFVEPFGFAPKSFTQLKSNTIDALAKYTKAQTGAQATDNERKWLAETMPHINDSNEVFKDKNKEFKRRLKMIINRNLGMAKKYQGKIPVEWELNEAATFGIKKAGPVKTPEKFKNMTEEQQRDLYFKLKKSKQR